MRKLNALKDYILSKTGILPENLTAFADNGKVVNTGKDLGFVHEDGKSFAQVEICVWSYDAVITIERYAGDAHSLIALIAGWIADCDDEREGLADPELDIDINDAETCDVQIAIDFEEHVVVRENAAGDIVFDGLQWSVAEHDFTVATKLDGVVVHHG